jgi:stress response protein YsnF
MSDPKPGFLAYIWANAQVLFRIIFMLQRRISEELLVTLGVGDRKPGERADMVTQFSSRTGLPMVDFFFNGVAAMLEMQRAFTSRGMLTAPISTKFGPLQHSGHIEIGTTQQQVIPIPKEELRIGKRQVHSAKAYRVSATVVEVPVEEQVNLRAETVVIERRPTTGTTARGGQSFQDHTIEVHEMYEEPVIGKVITQAEEMVIYKTLSERTATVRETVRQTRVNVEEQPTVQVHRPAEIPNETSLKVEEPPKAPGQPVETARETGMKIEETKKASILPQAEIDVAAAGLRAAAGEKSRELPVVQNPGERKDHTHPNPNSGGDTKGRGSQKN